MYCETNILQIGYGAFGKHHCGSLLGKYNLYVLDPGVTIVEPLINQIGSLDEVVDLSFELVIIAVNASSHLAILDELSTLNVKTKKTIIEKVPDNSLHIPQKEIASNVFVNFPRRYYPFYRKLKIFAAKHKIKAVCISGGNNSLLCNALHYIDIFQFITGNYYHTIETELTETFPAKRRGFYDGLGNNY